MEILEAVCTANKGYDGSHNAEDSQLMAKDIVGNSNCNVLQALTRIPQDLLNENLRIVPEDLLTSFLQERSKAYATEDYILHEWVNIRKSTFYPPLKLPGLVKFPYHLTSLDRMSCMNTSVHALHNPLTDSLSLQAQFYPQEVGHKCHVDIFAVELQDAKRHAAQQLMRAQEFFKENGIKVYCIAV